MNKVHFSNITDFYSALGKPAPEHPLFVISTTDSSSQNNYQACLNTQSVISTDFYAISLKKVTAGEIVYGQTKYDCSSGTLLFFSPQQIFYSNGVTVESQGKTIVFHEDFIRGHALSTALKKASFFGYAVNEALHLSPKEQRLIANVIANIESESKLSYDEFSRDILLAHINVLLNYAERFYRRQFLLRKESHSAIVDSFLEKFDELLVLNNNNEIPSVNTLADSLNMTSRYLTDALKIETGQTAQQVIHNHLIDKAKNSLLESSDSVASIAYALGFAYPQYFARLFKNKVGLTPSQYRASQH